MAIFFAYMDFFCIFAPEIGVRIRERICICES